ncbi:hypothetical protein J6590_029498 [Homalodisca vitripennis]|nr:hypothetical protein J6590_029498 [Homalodisca vitripennis]
MLKCTHLFGDRVDEPDKDVLLLAGTWNTTGPHQPVTRTSQDSRRRPCKSAATKALCVTDPNYSSDKK